MIGNSPGRHGRWKPREVTSNDLLGFREDFSSSRGGVLL